MSGSNCCFLTCVQVSQEAGQVIWYSHLFKNFPQFVVIVEYSVQFSRSVMSDSLWAHESQHTRPPCPSPTPGVHSNLCPSSQWCHPAISSSVIPFSSCPQSFPASVFSNDSTLHMTWPKYWSFSFSIIPSKEHPGLIFRMDWLNLLAVQGTLKSLLQHHSSKASVEISLNSIAIFRHHNAVLKLMQFFFSYILLQEFSFGTSLLVQWLRISFQCSGCGFNPWSRN